MKVRKTVITLVVSSLAISFPLVSFACGGQTASIAELGEKLVTWTHNDGSSKAMDYEGKVDPAEINITPALAQVIAERFVDTYYPDADSLDFHAFVYEHGRYVYMYDISDPSISVSPSVTACGRNPQPHTSNKMDIHIDAITGDVWDGEGCGGGPSKILSKFYSSDYDLENLEDIDLLQFHSHFIVEQGNEPVIDGSIEKNEWKDAGHVTVSQYGFNIDMSAKIVGSTIYFAVDADTKNWLGLMLKASPQHGMVTEFSDAKLLSVKGVEDYQVISRGMMAGATLRKDRRSSLISQASTDTEEGRVYEFAMPLGEFNTGEFGMFAFYFGASPQFSGTLTSTDQFSDQFVMHIGEEIHQSVMTDDVPENILSLFGGLVGPPSSSGGNTLYLWIIAFFAVVMLAWASKKYVRIQFSG